MHDRGPARALRGTGSVRAKNASPAFHSFFHSPTTGAILLSDSRVFCICTRGALGVSDSPTLAFGRQSFSSSVRDLAPPGQRNLPGMTSAELLYCGGLVVLGRGGAVAREAGRARARSRGGAGCRLRRNAGLGVVGIHHRFGNVGRLICPQYRRLLGAGIEHQREFILVANKRPARRIPSVPAADTCRSSQPLASF